MKEKLLEFQVGETVILPGCGVGILSGREAMELEGIGRIDAYRVELGGDAGTTWIPVMMTTPDRMRPVMAPEAVAAAWETLNRQEAPDERASWPLRKRRYKALLTSGTPTDLASLAGELAAVRAIKALPDGEQTILEKARRLLVDEIAAATGVATEAIDARFDREVATISTS